MSDVVKRFEQRSNKRAKALQEKKALSEEEMSKARAEILDELMVRFKALVVPSRERLIFQAGDIIKWKPGMNNRPGLPPSADNMIITEVMMEPMFDDKNDYTLIGALEPLDLKVGVVVGRPGPEPPGSVKDLDFVEFLVDSRRVMHLND